MLGSEFHHRAHMFCKGAPRLFRLGKMACPHVNDDQKLAVDDKKLNSGRPHDDQLISGYSLIHLG